MISYVKGELAEVLEKSIVVEAGGVGIEIFVPTSVMNTLPHTGDEIKIYTYFRVSEDDMSLYGFNSRRDLDMFRELIGVSGIGPKGALAILSCMTPDDLRMAIMSGDAKAIAQAQGIGAKTAQRVIIDLKDKIGINDLLGAEPAVNAGSGSASVQEAVEALVSLGYSASGAAKAVHAVEGAADMDVEELLKAALKRM